MSEIPSASRPELLPLRFQEEVVDFLKETEPELWQWASSAEAKGEFIEETRTTLLKSNYRLDADAHPQLAERCAKVKERLNLTVPVTLYQSTGALGMNAMLCFVPGEAHVIFAGPILTTLQEAELEALLGHELAHYALWSMRDGEFLAAERLLHAAVNDVRATATHAQTALRFRLYTEIFADRGSLIGSKDLHAAVAMLVKTETGLSTVSASSYLRQADEIFERSDARTEGISHPESFIRARALRLWSEQNDGLDSWLSRIIEGYREIDSLDLVSQRHLGRLTRRFLGELLRPVWFQSDPTLVHARAFFPDFSPGAEPDDSVVIAMLTTDAATREYYCYLLLDFASIDPELEQLPLAAALLWSQRLEISEPFEKLVLKELSLGKRALSKLKKEAAGLIEMAEAKP